MSARTLCRSHQARASDWAKTRRECSVRSHVAGAEESPAYLRPRKSRSAAFILRTWVRLSGVLSLAVLSGAAGSQIKIVRMSQPRRVSLGQASPRTSAGSDLPASTTRLALGQLVVSRLSLPWKPSPFNESFASNRLSVSEELSAR